MGLSFVAVFLYAGSLSTSQIVAAQAHGTPFQLAGITLHAPSWYAVLLLPSFAIYLVTMVGETNRLPVRPARRRGRDRRGLPYRVRVAEVHALLPGRVHQHDNRGRARDNMFLGGLAGSMAHHDLVRRQQRLVANAVVPRQGIHPAVRVHLAPRHLAPRPLRPADEAWLEDSHPHRARVDPARRLGALDPPGQVPGRYRTSSPGLSSWFFSRCSGCGTSACSDGGPRTRRSRRRMWPQWIATRWPLVSLFRPSIFPTTTASACRRHRAAACRAPPAPGRSAMPTASEATSGAAKEVTGA